MRMQDLISEKYQYKLRTIECIEILREQNKKRLENANIKCEDCLYSACSNSLNEICIENQCFEQLINVFDDVVGVCIQNDLLDENSRVFKVYKEE